MIKIDLRKHWKIILLLVLVFMAVLMSIALLLANSQASDRISEDALIDLPTETYQEFTVHPESLMLPNIAEELWRGIYEPHRPPKKQWGMEELKKYLYAPLDLAAENLRSINQESIDALLDSYR